MKKAHIRTDDDDDIPEENAPHAIDRIGWWVLRCIVTAGAVFLYCTGREAAAETFGALVFVSLFFGDV